MDDFLDLRYFISMFPKAMCSLETVEQAAEFFEGMHMSPCDIALALNRDISDRLKVEPFMNPQAEYSVIIGYLADKGFRYDTDARRFREAV